MVNGNPIMARSAVNVSKVNVGKCVYRLDDGTTLTHEREDGAVVLAIKMLKTIKEVK